VYILREDTTLKQRKIWYEKVTYPDEAWKEIEGSNGVYLISSYGRVKKQYKTVTRFILPVLKKEKGYLEVKVTFQGKHGRYRLGRLVAHHFLGKAKEGYVIHYKNRIKTDCSVKNLKYMTLSEHGRKTGPRSKSKPVVQIDAATLEVVNEYRSAREAGRKCFISYQAVLDNCNGKTKYCGDGAYLYRFLEDYENDSCAHAN
jgi:hypothetical protein